VEVVVEVDVEVVEEVVVEVDVEVVVEVDVEIVEEVVVEVDVEVVEEVVVAWVVCIISSVSSSLSVDISFWFELITISEIMSRPTINEFIYRFVIFYLKLL
jgi:hypothetical protein